MNDWQAEVVELHEYFEGYLGGALPADLTDRMTDAFADEFSMVNPDGMVVDTASVVTAISGQHGQHKGMKMWITDFDLITDTDVHVIGRYIEHQKVGEDGNRRLSTVVFRKDDAAPNGLRWLALHETWLP